MKKNKLASALLAGLVVIQGAAWTQTRLDLRTQTKNVDFSGALTTRPIRVGTVIPAVCTSGEMFFKSDAPAGSNLFGCTATNTWTVMSASTGTSTSGPFYCVDTGAVNAYACSGISQVSSYTAGQLFLLKPALANTGAATLNINGLGAKSIRKNGSQTLSANDFTAGQVVSLAYDGSVFQVQALGIAGPAIGGLLTTKGDTVAHDGSAAVRLAVCPDGQIRIADSTQSSGWRCGAATGGGSGPGVALCAPASANGSAYACSVPSVTAYTTDLTLLLRPDVASAGPATINVNGLGAKALLRSTLNGIVAGELTAGSPYLISYDGSAFRLQGEAVEPDGTGTITINRNTIPHSIGVVPSVFGALNGANTWMGNNDFSGGLFAPPHRTVATLPGAGANNKKLFVVTDGATSSDCSAGGGSYAVLCRSNGSVWAALTGGTGVGTGTGDVVGPAWAAADNFTAFSGTSGKIVKDSGVGPSTVVSKGTGFGAGGAAVIDTQGKLAKASGTSSDCLHVDGSSAPCAAGTGSEYLYKAANVTIDCDGTDKQVASYTIPANTLTAGDVIEVRAATHWVSGSDTDALSYVKLGSSGSFPNCCIFTSAMTMDMRYAVLSSTSQVTSGLVSRSTGTFEAHSYSDPGTENVANPITLSFRHGYCDAGSTYRLEYFIVRRIH